MKSKLLVVAEHVWSTVGFLLWCLCWATVAAQIVNGNYDIAAAVGVVGLMLRESNRGS